MKILFASGSPLAGVCELNARLISELYPGIHEARVLNNGPGRHAWYLRPGSGRPKTYSLADPSQVREALEWCDHCACQANVGARNLKAVDLLKKKTWSFIWHGCEQNGCLDRSFKPEDYKHVRFTSIGQGWIERQASFFAKFDLKVVPNLISIDDSIHRPIPWADRIQRVAFAPSNTRAGAVNDKGVAATEAALAGLPLKVLLRRPFEECMREKQKSVLGIDELVTPSYHRSGLEFLSQGTTCMCSVGEAAEKALKDATGAIQIPFVCAKGAGLGFARRFVTEYLAAGGDAQAAWGAEARAWMEQFYAPKALLDRHYLPVYAG